MPMREQPDDDVTVICADEKAFRNIAFTAYGTHMPGRFALKHLQATLLEIDFPRKHFIVTIQQIVLDVVFWQSLVVFTLVFIAWIHAACTGCFSLFPAYGGLFLSIIMMNNYFVFGMGGPLHTGFVLPSWEDMLLALTRTGKSNYIEPLETNSQQGTSQEDFKTRAVTYWPIGFQEGSKERLTKTSQMDFPFSRGIENYRKLTVGKSLVPSSKQVFGFTSKRTFGHNTEDDLEDKALNNEDSDNEEDPSLDQVLAESGITLESMRLLLM